MSACITQRAQARAGNITPEMQRVAIDEQREPAFIRDEVAAGRMVIPANPAHSACNHIGIGINARCKINANIGQSPGCSDHSAEFAKLDACIMYGADTVMDLSTGDNIDELRRALVQRSSLPLGTVPVYQAVNDIDDVVELTPDDFLSVIEKQAQQGVDYMTIHCGLLKEMIPLALTRRLGIVSRGGALMAQWMTAHNEENPYYTYFNDILDICRIYDVTLSLGDGLRPGCLADASDEAQFAELDILGALTERCAEADVQVMIEGPGHIPFNEIEMNVQRQREVCKDAPFYVLGPVVCDIAPGYDHITSAIGATAAATAGAAMLCYVTPKEHLGLPTLEDVRTGIIAYKIAAHAADVARNRPGARERDDAMADARRAFDWEKQFSLALDPARAKEYFAAANTQISDASQTHCSMCGDRFCAMKNSQSITP